MTTKENLGELQHVVKASKRPHIAEIIIAIITLLIVVIFPDQVAQYVWLGFIPLILLLPVLAILLFIVGIMGLVKIGKIDNTLEIYENGIVYEDFVASYSALSFQFERGFSATKVHFSNGIQSVVVPFPILPKHMKIIRKGIKNA